MASGTYNQHEAAGRARKVERMVVAAENIVTKVAGDHPIDRQLTYSDLIHALEHPEAVDFDAWAALVCSAEVRAPSPQTMADTLTALRRQLVFCEAAYGRHGDPFARLGGEPELRVVS